MEGTQLCRQIDITVRKLWKNNCQQLTVNSQLWTVSRKTSWMSQQGVAFLWEEVRQVVLTVWFSISCLEFPYSIFSLEVDGMAGKRSLFPYSLHAVTMPVDKTSPTLSLLDDGTCYCAMNFNGYTKTLKVDKYRSLSAVRLHGADPVLFLTIFTPVVRLWTNN